MREIRQVLDGLRVELVTLSDLPSIAEPEETGATFAENARLKAGHYAEASGLPTVAEDSGLSIDAIDGRPGVRKRALPGRDLRGQVRESLSRARVASAAVARAIRVRARVCRSGPRNKPPGLSTLARWGLWPEAYGL